MITPLCYGTIAWVTQALSTWQKCFLCYLLMKVLSSSNVRFVNYPHNVVAHIPLMIRFCMIHSDIWGPSHVPNVTGVIGYYPLMSTPVSLGYFFFFF